MIHFYLGTSGSGMIYNPVNKTLHNIYEASMIFQPFVFDKKNKDSSISRFSDKGSIHFYSLSRFNNPFIVAVVHELLSDSKTVVKHLIVDKKSFPIRFKRLDDSLNRFALLLGFKGFRFCNTSFDNLNELEDYYYQLLNRTKK